jgi:hypothetical protein
MVSDLERNFLQNASAAFLKLFALSSNELALKKSNAFS